MNSVLEESPTAPAGDVDRLWGLVYATVGAASMCWERPDKAGVFQSETAAGVASNLIQQLVELGYIDRFYALPPRGYRQQP